MLIAHFRPVNTLSPVSLQTSIANSWPVWLAAAVWVVIVAASELAWIWHRLHENPECFWNRKWKTFLLLATTLMRKNGRGLPWLITPGKIWPPAVNTDPTIDASLALPYNHLRTKLCSAIWHLHFVITQVEPRCWFPPAPRVSGGRSGVSSDWTFEF